MNLLVVRAIALAVVPLALSAVLAPAAAGQAAPAARAAKFLDAFNRADCNGKAVAFDLLEPADHPAVLEACFKALESPFPRVFGAAVAFLGSAGTGEPQSFLVAKGFTHRNPLVRASSVYAARSAKGDDLSAAAAAAAADESWMVRCAAADVVSGLRIESGFDAIAALASDPDPRVRVEAMLAVARLRTLSSAPAITAAMSDKSWQVRSAAIEAMLAAKPRAAFPALIEMLAEENGRLRLEALQALASLSGVDLGDDPQTWREWWIAQTRKKGTEGAIEPESSDYVIRGKRTPSRRFFTAQTDSRRVVFVLDVSQSMTALAKSLRPRPETRAGGQPTRFSVLLDEIEAALRGFGDADSFNVIVFGTKVDAWKPQMQNATAKAREDAVSFIRAHAPSGETNLFDALARAFGATPSALSTARGYFDEMAGMKAGMNWDTGPDTIFLLSDGVPNVGTITDGPAIAAEIARANRTRRIVIHAIAVGQFQADFLRKLAMDNKGSWVVIGD